MPLVLFRFFFILVLCLSLSACITTGESLTDSNKSETNPSIPPVQTASLRATMLLPLSGKDSKLGEAMQNAATLALADLGYKNFELGFEDTAKDGAPEAARRAIRDKSQILIGPIFADDVRAVRAVSAPAQIPVVAFSTDSSAAGSGTYLIGILPDDQARQIALFAAQKKLQTVLVVAPRDPYGQLTVRAFSQVAQANGMSIIGPFWLDQNDSSLAIRLDALIADGVDGLFMPLPADQAARIVTLVQPLFEKRGHKPVLMGTGLWDDANMMKFSSLAGGYYAAPDHKSRMRFEQVYTRQFGEKPPRLAALAYDAAALTITLGAMTGQASPVGQNTLIRPNGFSGINGLFRFLPDGRSERRFPILQLQPGATTVAVPAQTHF